MVSVGNICDRQYLEIFLGQGWGYHIYTVSSYNNSQLGLKILSERDDEPHANAPENLAGLLFHDTPTV